MNQTDKILNNILGKHTDVSKNSKRSMFGHQIRYTPYGGKVDSSSVGLVNKEIVEREYGKPVKNPSQIPNSSVYATDECVMCLGPSTKAARAVAKDVRRQDRLYEIKENEILKKQIKARERIRKNK